MRFADAGKGGLLVLGLACILFLVFLTYSPALQAPFIFDDYHVLVNNDGIKDLSTAFRNYTDMRYVLWLSFALNYAAGGLNPFGYHLVSVLLHAANVLLFFYLIRLTLNIFSVIPACRESFFKKDCGRAAMTNESNQDFPGETDSAETSTEENPGFSLYFIPLAAAFIFALHPIQTQAVNYISQRSVLLATFFSLLSMSLYARGRIIQLTAEGRRAARMTFLFFLSVCSAFLAMKSKETAFTLPFAVILYELCFLRSKSAGQRENILKKLLPLVLMLIIICVALAAFAVMFRVVDLENMTLNVPLKETDRIGRSDYLMTQFRVIVTYLRLLVFPVGQSIDYTYPLFHSFFTMEVFFSFLLLMGIFSLGVYLFFISRDSRIGLSKGTGERRISVLKKSLLSSLCQREGLFPSLAKRGEGRCYDNFHDPLNRHELRMASFGIFWFFLSLSVESSIIPIRDVIFEHRIYHPSLGFILTTVSLFHLFIRNEKAKIVIVTMVIAVFALLTVNRNLLWREPRLLWEEVLSKYPTNVRGLNAIGAELKEEGKYAEALSYFRRALETNPGYVTSYFNMGDLEFLRGDYKKAVDYFEKALSLNPPHYTQFEVMMSLGIAYSEMGSDEKAEEVFSRITGLYPGKIASYNNLGRQYVKMGRANDAIRLLEKGLSVRESSSISYNLSLAYGLKGDSAKSEFFRKKALALQKAGR